MLQVFEFTNEILNPWGEFLWGIAWQAGVIGLLIASVVMWKKKWGSSLKYWLLVVALVKFLVPPFLALPTGILGHSSAYVMAAIQTVTTCSIPSESARRNVTPAVREGRPSPAVLPPESTELFVPPTTEPIPPESVTAESIITVPNTMKRVQTFSREAVTGSETAIPWGSIAFIVYLTGVFAGGALILRQRIRLAGIVSRSTLATTETLGIDIGSLPVQLRTSQQPCILISEEAGTPMAFGILRPTILLPKADWSDLSTLDRRTVLYHELAHLRRRDPMINGLQLIVRTIWWCHPVAHLVNGLLVKVREECCDDLLLREELATPIEYSEVLLRSVTRFRTAGLPMVLEMARHPLEPRLRRILDGKILRLPRLNRWHIGAICVIALLMLPGIRQSQAVDPVSNEEPQITNEESSPVRRSMVIKVVDEMQRPIKGAKVFRNHVYRPTSDEKPKIENETYFTSDTGEASVELSGSSVDLRLWVSKPDYVKLHAMWAANFQSDGDQIPEEFTFVLERGITIGGKIVDFEGNPIAGAVVEARLHDDGTDGYSDRGDRTKPGIRPVFERSLTDSDREIITDEQGIWTINNVPDLKEFFNRNTQEPFFGPDGHRDSPVDFSVSHPRYLKFESNIDQNQASELSRKKLIERSSQIYLLPEKKARRNPIEPTSETEKRVTEILVSLRRLNHTVDETETWTSRIRELVSIGSEAVPQLVEELDATSEDLMIRRLAFTLRAIDDPRAVPGLIRTIPKTLCNPRSDFGLLVDDPELTRFMKRYDLNEIDRNEYFSLGRPYREVMGALQKLTGRDAGALELNWIRLSESPLRAALQRTLFHQEAKVWETWWKDHCRELTTDEKFYEVDLDQQEEHLPPRVDESTIKPHLKREFSGMTLSPFVDQTKFRTQFYDIDTGYSPAWPEPIPRSEEEIDYQKLGEWANEHGVDLMCVSHRSPDGTISYELRGFDLTVWDISSEDVEELRRSIDNVEFPSGDPVGKILIPIDQQTKNRTPGSIGSFAFMTREGTKGIIEIGDRVTEVRDLTGQLDDVKGVGFHLGVRFNLSTVIP